MEHPVPPLDAALRPWRQATLVAAAIAAVELVALVAAGVALLGKPLSERMRDAAVSRVLEPAHPAPAKRPPPPGRPKLARGQTSIVVLNGNGRTGAAAATAARVRARGYRVRAVGNARRSDYARTVVMYRPGYRGDAARLARELGVRIVAPLDGMRPAELLGAQLALIVGG